MRSANPPLTSAHMPMWIPGANEPFPNEWHWLRSPASHAGQTGDTPRVTHVSHGLRATRSPGSSPSASGPTATTSAITSWPITWGIETKFFIGFCCMPAALAGSIRLA